jgi:tryptophan-rich sensory protein
MTVRASDNRLLIWIAIGFVLLVVVSFTPSDFKPVAAGTFSGPPILHLHGLFFFAWPILFLIQAILAGRGKIATHRALGLLGVALATSMLFTGVLAVASDLRANQQGLALVAFAGLVLFALFVVLAVITRRTLDHHMRWMFLATLVLMQAVSARFVVRVLMNGPPPLDVPQAVVVQRAGMIHLAFDVLVLVIVCIADWRKRGRPHPVFLVGGGALVLMHAFRHLLLDSSAWRNTADAIMALTS